MKTSKIVKKLSKKLDKVHVVQVNDVTFDVVQLRQNIEVNEFMQQTRKARKWLKKHHIRFVEDVYDDNVGLCSTFEVRR